MFRTSIPCRARRHASHRCPTLLAPREPRSRARGLATLGSHGHHDGMPTLRQRAPQQLVRLRGIEALEHRLTKRKRGKRSDEPRATAESSLCWSQAGWKSGRLFPPPRGGTSDRSYTCIAGRWPCLPRMTMTILVLFLSIRSSPLGRQDVNISIHFNGPFRLCHASRPVNHGHVVPHCDTVHEARTVVVVSLSIG